MREGANGVPAAGVPATAIATRFIDAGQQIGGLVHHVVPNGLAQRGPSSTLVA
jgi:hypothetical protein